MIISAQFQPQKKILGCRSTAQRDTTQAGYLPSFSYTITVRSNPLAALQNKLRFVPWFRDLHSVTVVNNPFHVRVRYKTVSDFLSTWHINYADTKVIRIPFLKHKVGGGDAFASVAERFPLRIKLLFDGCLDRREWFNWNVVFVPWRLK